MSDTPLKRHTVNLPPRAQEDLVACTTLSRANATDATIKALALYALILTSAQEGKQLAMVQGDATTLVHLL